MAFKLRAEIERWRFKAPFRITGYTWTHAELLLVTLEQNGCIGRGEAAGVFYKNETPTGMLGQIEAVRARIEAGIDIAEVQALLPPGGARNALDSAVWDLRAKMSGRPVWRLAEIEKPKALLTTFTCGADTPEKMGAQALAYAGARAIKLKLTGDPIDSERVLAVRAALPGVWIGVDANRGFTRQSLEHLMPLLIDSRVALIEQPFPIGNDTWLDDLHCPIPIAADESVQSLMDIPRLVGRYNVFNIKLDKCGGLTEGLAMARAARAHGLEPMVGTMMGTSLGMAPAFLVGQICTIVDLDGPVFLESDRNLPVTYTDGLIDCPKELWGHPTNAR
jgi:L-Ala-D/L-Glu epimerase